MTRSRTAALLTLAAVLPALLTGCAEPDSGPARPQARTEGTSADATRETTSETAREATRDVAQETSGETGRRKVTARRAATVPVRVPAGVTAGYVVVDAATGKTIASHRVHHRFRSASVVKILIAIDYLERNKGRIPAADLALLTPMLRGSDDDAATALWRRGGQGAIVRRMAHRIGLTETSPPPATKPGFWGYTAISAADISLVYRYLLRRAEPRVRDFVLGNLRKASQCARDGFDQYFGIPRAVSRPWAVKQGWSGYGAVPPVKCTRAKTASYRIGAVTMGGNPVDFGRPVLHTTGVIGDRLIMVVLTLQPSGASFTKSAERVTKLARDLYLSVAQQSG
ncbi:hypothetical protein GCM10010116_29750 [Microbispora rosea subsp. aerata]|nr:hypothetical protein [Microbispora rosea]GGO14751.1 hypothetical protein GCM10010116_29750 [Microbispora rosea subsp. aerata]GIH55589.1 hypothetical protein Mro02_25030 [Microbispora rosea subsp. aerata]GLJ86569.1 hypothetical protein GCM10017588_53070 [Microbispora rosea subsp. aerata]